MLANFLASVNSEKLTSKKISCRVWIVDVATFTDFLETLVSGKLMLIREQRELFLSPKNSVAGNLGIQNRLELETYSGVQ